MTRYFVWVNGLKGPEAQLWDEKNKHRDGKPVKVLFGVEISDSATLEDCIELYPYEAKP